MDLNKFFKEKGYDLSGQDAMRDKIKNWEEWYQGDVATFHTYSIYNGEKNLLQKRQSMQMAKTVSEDWANLLMNEKVEIVVDNEKYAEFIEEVFRVNDFYINMNKGIELTFALGTGAVVLGLEDMRYDMESDIIYTDESRMSVEYVKASKVFPLSYDNGGVKECAFATTRTEDGNTYVYIAMHVIGETGTYVIQNYKLKQKKNSNSYTDVTDETEGFLPLFDTKMATPWFFILKPNIINNVDTDSPFGISVFANSISTMKFLDVSYDSFFNEYVLGRKRIFVSSEVLKVDPTTGDSKLVFDPNDVVFYSLPQDMDGKNMLQDSDLSIRADDHEKGISMNLNILSRKCGFGEKHYKFDNGAIATTTQVVSENSTLFRSLKKHEIGLEQVLIDLSRTIIAIGNEYLGLGRSSKEFGVSIVFDDSIIEDKDAEMKRDLILVDKGLMSKVEFRVKYFGETEEEAMKMLPQEDVLSNDWGV